MLEVLGEPSMPCKPREGALDDPAFGQDNKPGKVWPFDDFKAVAEHGLGPMDDALFVAAIHEDFEEVG